MKKLNENKLITLISLILIVVLSIVIILVYEFSIKPINRPKPYDKYFETNYVVKRKDAINSENKIFKDGTSKLTILPVHNKVLVGYIVEVEATNIKINAGGTGSSLSNEFKFKLFLDKDKKLIGHEFIQYGHSDGSFQKNAISFLETIIKDKKNINDINDYIKIEDNLKVGATETIKSLFVPVLEEVYKLLKEI